MPPIKVEPEIRFQLRVNRHGPLITKLHNGQWPEILGTRCHVFNGKKHHGYGCFWDGTKEIRAHRYAWLTYKGPIPKDLFVLHKCDNRPCCNPFHLFVGTQLQNRRDCVAKDRQAKGDKQGLHLHPESRPTGDRNASRKYPGIRRGERNGNSKFKEQDIRDIRSRHHYLIHRKALTARHAAKLLARKYEVTPQMIWLIITRKNWKHV